MKTEIERDTDRQTDRHRKRLRARNIHTDNRPKTGRNRNGILIYKYKDRQSQRYNDTDRQTDRKTYRQQT